MTQNTQAEAQGTQAQAEGTQGTQPDGMAALLAAAVAQGAQAAQAPKAARWRNVKYGVRVTQPEGVLMLVRYDTQGRELASWWGIAADGTWAVQMKRMRDIVSFLEAAGAGDVA